MRLLLVALLPLAACTPSSEDLPPPPAVPDAGPGGVTDVSGAITADATWSGDVQLSGDVVVAAGVTLTIAAGTHVVAGDAGIAVNGTLVVAGTEAQQVSFDASSGSWSGITVQSGGQASLAYANITQAATGFDCAAGAAGCTLDHVHLFTNVRSASFSAPGTITYSTLERTSSIGIAVNSGADLSISDSRLTTAGGDIVVQNGGNLKIDYSEIGKVVDSYEHCGLHINRADGLVIEHSDIHSNVYGGMIGGTTNARINFSNWSQNSFDVDDLGGNVGLDLKNNYWEKTPPSSGDTSGAASARLTVGPR